MAQLIDILLVTFIVLTAVGLTLRYLWGLVKPPDEHTPVHCAGCDAECHARELVMSAWTPLRSPTPDP